jgi:hypothetical protein
MMLKRARAMKMTTRREAVNNSNMTMKKKSRVRRNQRRSRSSQRTSTRVAIANQSMMVVGPVLLGGLGVEVRIMMQMKSQIRIKDLRNQTIKYKDSLQCLKLKMSNNHK